MKKLLFAAVIICQFMLAGTLLAATVDFTTLGGNSVDISTGGYTIGDVAFSYDNFGSLADKAFIDANGINGSTYGALMINFANQVIAISFNFAMVGANAADPDALFATLTNGITNAYIDLTFPSNASGLGFFSYSGMAFDKVSMFFDLSSQTFTLDSLSYTPVEVGRVPEPASMILLAFGLLSLAGLKVRPAAK